MSIRSHIADALRRIAYRIEPAKGGVVYDASATFRQFDKMMERAAETTTVRLGPDFTRLVADKIASGAADAAMLKRYGLRPVERDGDDGGDA